MKGGQITDKYLDHNQVHCDLCLYCVHVYISDSLCAHTITECICRLPMCMCYVCVCNLSCIHNCVSLCVCMDHIIFLCMHWNLDFTSTFKVSVEPWYFIV